MSSMDQLKDIPMVKYYSLSCLLDLKRRELDCPIAGCSQALGEFSPDSFRAGSSECNDKFSQMRSQKANVTSPFVQYTSCGCDCQSFLTAVTETNI